MIEENKELVQKIQELDQFTKENGIDLSSDDEEEGSSSDDSNCDEVTFVYKNTTFIYTPDGSNVIFVENEDGELCKKIKILYNSSLDVKQNNQKIIEHVDYCDSQGLPY